MRYSLVALLALMCHGAMAADDDTYRLMKVEQDVRNLERQVQTLTRELDSWNSNRAYRRSRLGIHAPSGAPSRTSSTAWLEAARWDRMRTGMSELEVIDVLGPPTSMRQEGDTRVLLYAMEIGASGFLGGSVEFRDRAVSEINNRAEVAHAYFSGCTTRYTPLITNWMPMQMSRKPMMRAIAFMPVAPSTLSSRVAARSTM